MSEGAFNMELREFLTRAGVGSRREIESAVGKAFAAGALGPFCGRRYHASI